MIKDHPSQGELAHLTSLQPVGPAVSAMLSVCIVVTLTLKILGLIWCLSHLTV